MKTRLALAVCLAACNFVVSSNADDYAHPEMLLEPESLSNHLGDFVILDARAKEAFDESRVPGARWVDQPAWAKAFGDGKDAEAWSKRLGELGIKSDSKIAVYDDGSTKEAARIWWILSYWGMQDVSLINGGYLGWKSQALGEEYGAAKAPKPTEFKAQANPARLATKDQIIKSLDSKSLQIVDARSKDEFCGKAKMSNKRGGAIPGAKNLEWSDLLDPTTKRFKPADELKNLFEKAGVDLSLPTAAHCQSGGRSSVMTFGLRLMGVEEARNYYASWSEWGNADDTPVEVPKE